MRALGEGQEEKGGVGETRGKGRMRGAGGGREEGRKKHGKRKGWGVRRQKNKGVRLSSVVVNLQEATALGHMQGC